MKRVVKTFLLSILIVMALGTAVQAKDMYKYNYKAIATKQNTWVKPKGYDYNSTYDGNSTWTYTNTYYRYKVNVPANYYMALTLKCKNGGSLSLYKALKAENSLKSYNIDYDLNAETFYIALPKGTYYFGLNWNDNGLVFKYKLYKYVNKPNYKSSKALNWNANKKIAIVQLPGHNYDRWYKIKLTKKKRVYIWGAKDIDLFDAKRQPLQVASNNNSDGYTYSSYDKLKAGIYYIRVLGARPSYYNPWFGRVEIVWWK